MYLYKYNLSQISVKLLNKCNEWMNERNAWQITHIQTIYMCILSNILQISQYYSVKSNLYSINYLLLKCHLENWSSWNNLTDSKSICGAQRT